MKRSTLLQFSFWPAALVAAVVVLLLSIQLGKAIGAEMLAHGIGGGKSVAQAPPASAAASEVVGARPFVAGAPGQATPR